MNDQKSPPFFPEKGRIFHFPPGRRADFTEGRYMLGVLQTLTNICTATFYKFLIMPIMSCSLGAGGEMDNCILILILIIILATWEGRLDFGGVPPLLIAYRCTLEEARSRCGGIWMEVDGK